MRTLLNHHTFFATLCPLLFYGNNRSVVQQGDRGSTPEELLEQFPDKEFPQYRKFVDISTYCSKVGVTQDGAWWHHGEKNGGSNM